ncbi:putative Basic leucine-zipper 4 [Tripterygium wilfordii]|uniref:Putative Basic leucine-zipper 4 n=1 Tax=Tripterygium wilfordii TaxID=458696 RepID=A0A7J7D1X9_TRIWF|nr:basic leucine zipper 4-like [Tripterygium wilfordii]KAF5740076.1 putative Basic leucine-zipper 4 [Tripterygium wilfordii]
MLPSQEAVQFHYPVLETEFTPDEIQELLSLFELPETPNSGSEVSNPSISSADEKKRKRKISNRESAQRSRLRKKRHVEDLTKQVNQLKIVNQDLKNRLGSTLDQCNLLWRYNDQLRSESVALLARLLDLYQFLGSMQSC